MAIFPPWCLRTVVTLLAVRLSTEQPICNMWSSAGDVVQTGSSFRLYCTFTSTCDGAMYEDSTLRLPISLNLTTLYIDVVNITQNTAYSCQCKSGKHRQKDPCGVDIVAGSPPDRPRALTCVQNVIDLQPGVVVCSWNSGTKNNLRTTSSLWVRSPSGNQSVVPVKGSDWLSASLPVASSAQTISVKVSASNKLGTTESDTYNFTLKDIMKPSPPVLILVECSSRSCNITWGHSLKTQVQYITVAEQGCVPYPQDWRTSLSGLPSVHSLEPSSWYCFRARAKLSTGLWSDWSTTVSNRTQEEAPHKEPDVWFAQDPSKRNTLTVYWKLLNDSEARVNVLGYKVHIKGPAGNWTNQTVSASTTRLSVHQSCDTCLVTVSAYNSIGSSPEALVPTHVKTAQPPQELRVIESRYNVSLYWRKTDPTLSTGYLVEWYLQGQQFETLQWLRLSSTESQAVIKELKPNECYDGSVHVFNESSVGKAGFAGVNILVSKPTGGPSVTNEVDGNTVKLTWRQIPRGQRGGCVRNYTIYVKNTEDSEKPADSFNTSEHEYTVKDLSPAIYSLWMTAWTEQGEGPSGSPVKFIIKQESNIVPMVCIIFVVIIAVLLGLWKLVGCQRLKNHHLPLVPDPSNSKWAKEFTDNKGKMDLGVYPIDSASEEEDDEEQHVVRFCHHPKVNDKDFSLREDITDVSSLYGPEWDPGTEPQTPYIQSLSHDSDSSHYTHGSQDTGTTTGYISSQAEESGVEGLEREEEEGCTDFSPCDGFHEPLRIGGTLTLDAVKIDCRMLWENCE